MINKNALTYTSAGLLFIYAIILLAIQIKFTFFQAPQSYGDVAIGMFARSYSFTSLLTSLPVIIIGIVLPIACIIWTKLWTSILLSLFSLFALWFSFSRGIEIYLSPPFSDGSIIGSISAWFRFSIQGSPITLIVLFIIIASLLLAFADVFKKANEV